MWPNCVPLATLGQNPGGRLGSAELGDEASQSDAVVILGARILSCGDASRPCVTGPVGRTHLLKAGFAQRTVLGGHGRPTAEPLPTALGGFSRAMS